MIEGDKHFQKGEEFLTTGLFSWRWFPDHLKAAEAYFEAGNCYGEAENFDRSRKAFQEYFECKLVIDNMNEAAELE